MKKYYKLIQQKGHSIVQKGCIYPEDYLINGNVNPHTVSENVDSNYKDWKEVNAADYLIQEGFLPEKWCVRPNKETFDKVHELFYYLIGRFPKGTNKELNYHYPPKDSSYCTYVDIYPGYELLDFKTVYDKIMGYKEKRKITGYKIKEPCEYLLEAIMRVGYIHSAKTLKEVNDVISTNIDVQERLKEAKVFDLWVEPVYEKVYPKMIVGIETTLKEITLKEDFIEVEGKLIDKNFFIHFSGLGCFRPESLVISSVSFEGIEFSIDNIKDIANYYNNL